MTTETKAKGKRDLMPLWKEWAVGAPRGLQTGMRQLSAWMERHGGWALALLLAFYAPLVLVEAYAHPLSSDEIYTVHIARAPTLRAMWGMAREIDLHPPLHYLLQRVTLRLPGPIWLVARVPSMVAGAIATAVLYLLTARRLGSVLGWVAAAVLWTGPVEAFFWSNRPYMLGTALLLILIVAYLRAARESRRGWELLPVFVLSSLMISDQLIGIASLGAFAVAEAVRTWRRRKADWPIWISLFTPAVLAGGFIYQVRHLESNAFPASQIPTVGWAESMYGAQVTQMFFLVSVTVVVGAYLRPGLGVQRVVEQEVRPLRLDPTEGALSVGLILVPVVLMVVAAVQRLQYWERYSACAVLGFAGLIPWMIYRRMPRLDVLGPLLLLVFMGTTMAQVVDDATRGQPVAGRIDVGSLDGGLPLVAANPMTFTEMSDREPEALAQRLFYLTDRAEAQRISGYTLFENEEKIVGILGLSSHAEDAGAFYAEHPKFWLVADPKHTTEWLLQSLVERGATVAWKGRIQPGYDDSDLYLVTLPGSVSPSVTH